MSDKTKVEAFRDKATGLVWAANPGSPAHTRMTRGVERGEFERAALPADKQRAKTSTPPRRARKADDTE